VLPGSRPPAVPAQQKIPERLRPKLRVCWLTVRLPPVQYLPRAPLGLLPRVPLEPAQPGLPQAFPLPAKPVSAHWACLPVRWTAERPPKLSQPLAQE